MDGDRIDRTDRIEALELKAGTIGLSDEEAVELGHLYAEARGAEYSDAAEERARRHASAQPVKQERKERRRRLPLSFWRRKVETKPHILEVGQTANPPEDASRAA